MATINTINVGGIDKEIEDSVARSSSIYASNKVDTLDADVTGLHTQVEQIIAPTGEAPNPSEITDARIGYDDTVHSSLGNAIRNQMKDVYKELSVKCTLFKNLFNPDDPDIILHGYYNTSGQFVSQNSLMSSGFIPVTRNPSVNILRI